MWTGTIPADIHTDSTHGWWAQWAFTSRAGGVSEGSFAGLNLSDQVGDQEAAVQHNRSALAESFGSPEVSLAVMSARHSADVVSVHRTPVEAPNGCDALVTDRADVALVALAADCVPVLLADVDNAVIGAVHCGWRGLVADVVGAALAQLWRQGAAPQSTQALIGPAICGRCYGVPAEREQEVVAMVPAAAAMTHDGRPALDVRAGVASQLHAAGVASAAVGGCTYESAHLFSFRRDAVTGRQGAAIVLRRSA